MEGLPLEIGDVRREAALDPPEALLAVVTAEESLVQWAARHWYALVEHAWVMLVIPVLVAVITGTVLRLAFRRREPGAESG